MSHLKFPVEFKFNSFEVSAHMVFETLAVIIGLQYFLYLRKKQNNFIVELNNIWMLIGAVICALFFSSLIGALENPIVFLTTEQPLNYFFNHKTIVGGLLGGLIGVGLMQKLLKVKTLSTDLYTYPLILTIIIARIGCFCNGIFEDTYGTITTFKAGMDLGDGVLRHPVTLYEIIFLIYLWYQLLRTELQLKLINGYKFQLFLIAYLSFRFFLDFIKPGYSYISTYSMIQLTCFFGLLYYKNTIIKIFLQPSELFSQSSE